MAFRGGPRTSQWYCCQLPHLVVVQAGGEDAKVEMGDGATPPTLAAEATAEEDRPAAYQAAAAVASSISREADFTRVYQTNSWGSSESRSGGGSTFQSTANIWRLMGLVFKAYGIKSLLDIPCGDCHWQNLIPGFNDTAYLGIDIVKVRSAASLQSCSCHSHTRIVLWTAQYCGTGTVLNFY